MADPIITKIGDVSAYLDAVAHGFRGTRAEFGELLANSANYAQSAESAASAAVASAATATTKAGEATTAATAAQTAKTQTEAAASQALMNIGTAWSGAISAIQTEGATQTANATAQAQAAATSAATASTKASEASASATSAGQSATNAAASATSADQSARDAHNVLDSIPADYSEMSADVEQLKADLDDTVNELAYQDEKIGDIELANGSMSLSKTYNGINGNIGQEINITTTNSYYYIVTPLTGLNRVSIQTNVGTSATYPYYAYITDENDKIIERILPKRDNSSGDGYDTAVLIIKTNYKKLYVLCYGLSRNATITDNVPYALQKQIKSINHFFVEKDVVKMTNDALSDALAQNATINGLTFAFVTDTHSNGVFVSADRQTVYTGFDSEMTNTAFKQLINSGMVDCGVHCGDIISAYNITNSDYIKTVAEKLHDYTDLDKPVFFIKGNHECNAEEGLHEPTDVITPAQYYFAVQKISDTHKNFDEQNPFGGYYYTDFDQYKVRLIMLNCYIDPLTNGITTEFGSRQIQWFYSVALDLSTKNPDWGVIVFSHTGASSSAIRRIIQAFINKGVKYTYNDISYRFDDNSNGNFIALIHGHTHTDEYSDTYGYNNIGVDRGYAATSQSDNDRCCVDLFTVIPSTNYSHSSGVLYENRVGRGSSRSYNYGDTVGLITS